MANTNYEEFKNRVAAEIKDYLTEDYQDYDMEFQMISKASCQYEGLLIRPQTKGTNVIPVLNITKAYEDYESGLPFEVIMRTLADIRMNASLAGQSPASFKQMIDDFNGIKSRIYPRLINTASNIEYLRDKPHKDIEDLSIIYAVTIQETEEGISQAVITNDLLKLWNVTPDDIHAAAMVNLAERPPYFINIENAVMGGEQLNIEDIDSINPRRYRIPFFILSNKQITNGAAMAINPSVMDPIVRSFGNVYIIPSSIDEVILCPQDAIDDVNELTTMVSIVNGGAIPPQNRLSDNVYEYDIDCQAIRMVEV